MLMLQVHEVDQTSLPLQWLALLGEVITGGLAPLHLKIDASCQNVGSHRCKYVLNEAVPCISKRCIMSEIWDPNDVNTCSIKLSKGSSCKPRKNEYRFYFFWEGTHTHTQPGGLGVQGNFLDQNCSWLYESPLSKGGMLHCPLKFDPQATAWPSKCNVTTNMYIQIYPRRQCQIDQYQCSA